jgi:tetratricopeptide (TPR) repeat protein
MDIPTDPRKIRARIRSYERKLQREKIEQGGYDDGAGKRYMLASLYLLMGDLDGALKSFHWFDEEFSDDSGEPGHRLCWALALYRAGEMDKATRMLRKVMLLNLYLIPQLLGLKKQRLDIQHGSNWAEPDYVEWVPPEYFGLWDEQARAWAKGLYEGEAFRKIEARYVEIGHELLNLRPGPRRSQLIDEAQALRHS